MTQTLLSLTARDREILDQLAEHEPLSSSELCLLFFTGARSTRLRLSHLEDNGLLERVYPARSRRGGGTEALWFLSAEGRRAVGAPQRRPPGLSIPDLEHRRAVARLFCGLVERSLTRDEEGLWSWRGERTSERAPGGAVRPDGFGRYLLPAGEIIFYLELDRGTERGQRVGAKLRRYPLALANDDKREFANVLLVCGGAGRLANLARQAPAGPPWFWGTVDAQRYRLLPRGEERSFDALPALLRDPRRSVELCIGRRWRQHEGSRPRRSRGARNRARRGAAGTRRAHAIPHPRVRDRRARRPPPPPRPSADLVARGRDEWLRRLRSGGRSESALRAYRNAIDDLLEWAERECRAGELFEERAIVDYLDDYQRRLSPAPATYHRRFLVLRRFMRWVSRREGVPDPFLDLDAPPKPRQESDWLTPEEFQRMLAAAAQPQRRHTGIVERDQLVLLALVTTGLRRSELIALDWRDLNLDDPRPSLLVRRGKGGKPRRQPLAPQLTAELRQVRDDHRPAPSDPVFCGLAGGRLQPKVLAAIIKRATERAGIEKKVTAHTLRHTAASWLRQATGDARLVAEYLGHADLTTVSRYAHVAGDELHHAAATLADQAGLKATRARAQAGGLTSCWAEDRRLHRR